MHSMNTKAKIFGRYEDLDIFLMVLAIGPPIPQPVPTQPGPRFAQMSVIQPIWRLFLFGMKLEPLP
jgi:hypothetical protein